jgi:hypothetical protein
VDNDINLGAVACQSLIDRVIDQLKNHVMETRAIIGITDIHTRALSHRIQAF